ncbi:Farnesyl-diphosphate farnesyltransferase [Datura stramonium]|uniref:Farnesyl-diphosphate farnesyltransferase n=1 Tax=Datura stramonium TaxID=4076 RepID=A0ABS8RK00_DATST|nr:Farnesyl-diphosphate farnesyltransferase [Datura stramonium]
MGSLGAILRHPEDIYPLLKLKVAARYAEKQTLHSSHIGPSVTSCFLHKVSCSSSFNSFPSNFATPGFKDIKDYLGSNSSYVFGFGISYVKLTIGGAFKFLCQNEFAFVHQLVADSLIVYAFSIWFYEHLTLSTEDDTEGRRQRYKGLQGSYDQFHHVSTAFLELGNSEFVSSKGCLILRCFSIESACIDYKLFCYKEAIEDITMSMGAGMAKFIYKEVETIGDYDEYCHHVAGLVGLGLSKLFYVSGKEDVASDSLCNSMGLFLQIWSKYVNKLEDLKYKENSVKAVQCLNEMVTNALSHVEDCLTYMSTLRDPAIFRFCAIPQVMAIGTLAKCYNNIDVFRGAKMRRDALLPSQPFGLISITS